MQAGRAEGFERWKRARGTDMNERRELGSGGPARNVCICEGYRMPAGVRYPPKQEAAGHGR